MGSMTQMKDFSPVLALQREGENKWFVGRWVSIPVVSRKYTPVGQSKLLAATATLQEVRRRNLDNIRFAQEEKTDCILITFSSHFRQLSQFNYA